MVELMLKRVSVAVGDMMGGVVEGLVAYGE